MISFNIHYLFKIKYEFGEDTIQSITTSHSHLGFILSQEGRTLIKKKEFCLFKELKVGKRKARVIIITSD